MSQPSSRLLRLLALLQSRRFWTGSELAEQVDVTERTLRRDINKLRLLGYPVDATSGVAGGYQLGAGARIPPLLLDDEEALAVSIALRTAAATGISGSEEAALSALVKLERVLPHPLRKRANALRRAIFSLERGGAEVDSAYLSALAKACIDHESVSFEYQSRRQPTPEAVPGVQLGTPELRHVEPTGMVHTGFRWYLVAWDTNRCAWRTFRLDRICSPVVPGKTFTPRPAPNDGDLKQYVSLSVSRAPHEELARIVLLTPLAEARKVVPRAAGVLSSRDNDSCILETGASGLGQIAFWVAALGVEFRVEFPPDRLEELRHLSQRLQRALR